MSPEQRYYRNGDERVAAMVQVNDHVPTGVEGHLLVEITVEAFETILSRAGFQRVEDPS